MSNQKAVVLKVGGSLMYDAQLNLNVELFEKVKAWFNEVSQTHDAVVIVVGGGKLSRSVMEKVGQYLGQDYDRHGVAMELTQTNALVMRGFIGDSRVYCPETLGDAYEYLMGSEKRLMISGGLKRGWSTDMDAAVFADMLGEAVVYKLSDIDHVYTADPRKDSSAKIIERISWSELRKMFGAENQFEHTPNAHIPISVECTRFCEAKGITFKFSGGKTLEGVDHLWETFEEGTVITP